MSATSNARRIAINTRADIYRVLNLARGAQAEMSDHFGDALLLQGAQSVRSILLPQILRDLDRIAISLSATIDSPE